MTEFPSLFLKKIRRLSLITSFLCVFICARTREEELGSSALNNPHFNYGMNSICQTFIILFCKISHDIGKNRKY